ncbi:hypothetical protein VULLAG_LOCUS12814 [Vulpes lagopus]
MYFIDLIQGILGLLAGIKIFFSLLSLTEETLIGNYSFRKIKRKKPEYIVNPLRIQHNEFYHFTTSLREVTGH